MILYEQQLTFALSGLVDSGTILELDKTKYVFLKLSCEAKLYQDAASAICCITAITMMSEAADPGLLMIQARTPANCHLWASELGP